MTTDAGHLELRRRLASGTSRRSQRSGRLAIGVGVGALAVAGGLGVAVRSPSPPRPTELAAAPTSTTERMASSSTTTSIACLLQVSVPAADTDGDGCREALVIEDGVVVTGRGRYAVGRADDRLAFGDWDCDRTETPALLRPSTGEIWIFLRWASPTEEVRALPVAVVAGATDLVVLNDDANGCDDLAVTSAAGTQVVRAGGET